MDSKSTFLPTPHFSCFSKVRARYFHGEYVEKKSLEKVRLLLQPHTSETPSRRVRRKGEPWEGPATTSATYERNIFTALASKTKVEDHQLILQQQLENQFGK
jgi:hypothetical protein